MSYKKHIIIVPSHFCKIRVDKFLADVLDTHRSMIQKAILEGLVWVNKKNIKCAYIVQPQDEVEAHLPNIEHDAFIPEPIPLHKVYEDAHILVINKSSQMAVHPDDSHKAGTVAHGLAYHYKGFPLKNNVVTRPGLVHRIDKNTSGLLVVAKTQQSLVCLERQFYEHTIERIYYALVWGDLKEPSGTIDCKVSKRMYHQKNQRLDADTQQGKRAITHYQVLKRLTYVTLIACTLETGRTHQIRIHMQQIGHPLFGDPIYGGQRIVVGQPSASYRAFVENCFKIMPHQALHAISLGFKHPATQQFISFVAPLSEDFIKLLDKWERYTHISGGCICI